MKKIILALVFAGLQLLTPGSLSATTEVVVGNARFQFISPTCVRMEYAPDGKFIDLPSVIAVQRAYPDLSPFLKQSVQTPDGVIKEQTICTGLLFITYQPTGPFTTENLKISKAVIIDNNASPGDLLWQPGMKDERNLGGTISNLDGATGARDLGVGLLSRNGWHLLDDSHSALLTADGWFQKRETAAGYQDWIFFGYGSNYKQAFADFRSVCGAVPPLPEWAFGLWYSRYWTYSDQELRDIATRFEQEGIPLSVQVVDVDWHTNGWEGFDWNPKYFPDPEGFFKWMHDKGIHVPLNIHPIGPILPADKRYERFAQAAGLDPAGKKEIRLNFAARAQAQAYLDTLGEVMDQGADFWWIDYPDTHDYGGVNSLWWVNKLVYDYTLQRQGPTNTLIFSRWGGLGNHRYPLGFSGDTQSVWPVLEFETEMTATAGNVGQMYWSHDIGGFFGKKIDPELYVRWVQFGAFSPILRLHSDHGFRQPWDYPEPYCSVAKNFIKLREALRPYLLKASRITSETGLPLCRPMYVQWPLSDGAYHFRRQYMLGDDLLVAPIGEAGFNCEGLKIGYKEIWIPEGTWVDYFRNRPITGPTILNYVCRLDEMPLFIRFSPGAAGLSPRDDSNENWTTAYEQTLSAIGLPKFEITHRFGPRKIADGTVLPGDNPFSRIYVSSRFDYQDKGSVTTLVANFSNSEIQVKNGTHELGDQYIGRDERFLILKPDEGYLETYPLEILPLDKHHLTFKNVIDIGVENETRKFESYATVDDSFVQNWWVIGPFDAPGQTEFDAVFAPESATYDSAAPQSITLDGKALEWKKKEWQLPIPNDQGDPRFIDMRQVVADQPDIAAYALTYLHSDSDQKVRFKLGSDDGVRVWVNGQEAWKNNVGRGAEPGQDLFEVDLKMGSNPVLVKVCNMSFGWGLYLQVVGLDDQQLPSVQAKHEP
ncbi:MAG: hypothetical protein HJJLKODD_01924 [Phycisphaerae bacterium]|nr:hypothetical protein [Phycisphaerae bacterium]